MALRQRASQLALSATPSRSWSGHAAHISQPAHEDNAPLRRCEPNTCVSLLFCVKQKLRQYALDELHEGAKPKALGLQSLETRSTRTQIFGNQSSCLLKPWSPRTPEPSQRQPWRLLHLPWAASRDLSSELMVPCNEHERKCKNQSMEKINIY